MVFVMVYVSIYIYIYTYIYSIKNGHDIYMFKFKILETALKVESLLYASITIL